MQSFNLNLKCLAIPTSCFNTVAAHFQSSLVHKNLSLCTVTFGDKVPSFHKTAALKCAATVFDSICPMTTQQLSDSCQTTAQQQPNHFQRTAQQLPENYLTTMTTA